MIAIPNMEKPKECQVCPIFLWCYTNDWKGYEHCPLIDIVTCGECKKHGKNSCPMTFTYAVITDDNNYCSYAERRADE